MRRQVRFTIFAEAASKANSRRLVMFGKRPSSIKSHKAMAFVKQIREQAPWPDKPLEGALAAKIDIYYPSRRQDLDESALLDALQPTKTDPRCIYRNDREVKQRLTTWHLDVNNPRIEMVIWEKPGLDLPKVKRLKKR